MKLKKIALAKLLNTMGGSLALVALMITTLNVNTTCTFFAHQPKLPATSKKLRKF